VSAPESLAERASRLGWDAMALFGCAPKRPLDYSGSAGLLWAINGGRLVELHRDWAVIDLGCSISDPGMTGCSTSTALLSSCNTCRGLMFAAALA
jgi:hypothetical protein